MRENNPKIEITWNKSDDLDLDREFATRISLFVMELLNGRGGSVFGTLRPGEESKLEYE
jgi:hypothetical protein